MITVRRICCLAICMVAISIAAVPHPVCAAANPAPNRGIAVLASSIGHDFTPEALADFVQAGKFSPVVVDWAWITYHWDKTDFAAVNRFLDLVAAKKIPVAAMYRPRFLSNPTVPTQMNQAGERGTNHAEICYSDASARKWGISWGEKILDKCPSFREIIIYNPSYSCRCPKCAEASKSSVYGPVIGFLSEARSVWRKKQPEAKLGVVSMTDPGFWESAGQVIDTAHPYLLIRDDIDPAKDMPGIAAVRSIVKQKMGACLGKVTWEEGARVPIEKLKAVDDLAQKNGLSYFYWTFDTLFMSSLYDPKAVAQVVGMAPSAVEKLTGKTSIQPRDAANALTPEQLKAADALLDQITRAAPGNDKITAIRAVITKVKEMDATERNAVCQRCMAVMKDKGRDYMDRWPMYFVIIECRYEQAVPDLIELLQNDQAPLVRGAAAEALGSFPANKTAHDALVQAACKEDSQVVRDVLARRLGKDMPACQPGSTSGSAKSEQATQASPGTPAELVRAEAVKELATSGPPKPPAAPAKPVAKLLPWPFPGDYQAQHLYNNYQQPTDMYIHAGLDLLQQAGTPVTAVASGYVAAIATNYPQWKTHYFFIVTPEKGGSKGWCYVHMDPDSYTFKEGDHIEQGQILGKVVKFSLGDKPGVDHLHLHYVSFTKDASGKVDVHSLLDPLYFFDWKDAVAPSFQPLRFAHGSTFQQFAGDASGMMTVSGKVDILAAITDSAYPDHMCNLGVPVVMLSISDGTHTMQKLVLDHRGDIGSERQSKPLYLSYDEKKALLNSGPYPVYQVLRVTKTDGDGKIEAEDANECWDTTAKNTDGKPLWPNGKYNVNVYAWDIAGNLGVAGATVQVSN